MPLSTSPDSAALTTAQKDLLALCPVPSHCAGLDCSGSPLQSLALLLSATGLDETLLHGNAADVAPQHVAPPAQPALSSGVALHAKQVSPGALHLDDAPGGAPSSHQTDPADNATDWHGHHAPMEWDIMPVDLAYEAENVHNTQPVGALPALPAQQHRRSLRTDF